MTSIMLDEIKKLVEEYNKNTTLNYRVNVNWNYWITNTVAVENTGDYVYGQSWTVHRVISRDGLVLEIYHNENSMFIRIRSIYESQCTCECSPAE
ncbi:MAG: hypothetical protein QW251_03660 [Desulfurococcaceae archaeon]